MPTTHGRAFRDAVRQASSDVEWVEYPEETHGFWRMENQVDFRRRVERFLDRHIGPGAPTSNAAEGSAAK